MAKIYSRKAIAVTSLKPKKETISFLLNYSKVLHFVPAGKMNIEVIAN